MHGRKRSSAGKRGRFGRSTCRICCRYVPITTAGRFFRHLDQNRQVCPGSGLLVRPPRPGGVR